MRQIFNVLVIITTASLLAGCEENLRSEVEKTFFVNRSSLVMFVGDEIQLTASPVDGTYQYKWSSEDPKVVTVNNQGLVTAVGDGTTFIVVEAGELSNKIEVVCMTKIPLESISLNATSLELLNNDKVTVTASYYPDNYNYASEFVWYSEDPSVATVENGDITVVGEGVTNVVLKSGDIIAKVLVDAKNTRTFKGPHILSAATPYVLLAANFDLGGDGYAFYDADATNRTGNDDYRRLNGDIRSTPVEVQGDGVNIGYTNTGEWLLYTVEVKDAGNYLVESQVAGTSAGGFHVKVNGVNVTGKIATPNTGAWGTYVWVSTPKENLTLSLEKGTQKITYYFEGGHNFKALRFTKL